MMTKNQFVQHSFDQKWTRYLALKLIGTLNIFIYLIEVNNISPTNQNDCYKYTM